MICRACGHNDSEGQEFISLNIIGEIRINGNSNDVDIEVKDGWGYRSNTRYLYMCPECGTVKAE